MNPAEFANIVRCERDFWWYRGMEQILFRVLDPIAERRRLRAAMDAGCGTGHMAARLERHYGWRIFPTDLDREGLLCGLKNGFPQAMGELVRTLAPGGLLAMRTSALDILRSRHSEFTRERQRFMRKRLIELASGYGIRVLRTYANSLLLPVALTKFRIAEPLLRMKPASGMRPVAAWLDKLLYLALRLEAAWLASGRDLPLGQSLVLIGERIE
jgi:SAM-dependent methyltransferase